MSAEFEKRVSEWALWYTEHRNDGMSIDKRIAFMQKSIDGLLECLAIAAKDIQRLEGRNGNLDLKRQLLLPRGVVLHNPLR